MQFTNEEIAGGIDKDAARRKPNKIRVVVTLLASSALLAAIVFKNKIKAPTVH